MLAKLSTPRTLKFVNACLVVLALFLSAPEIRAQGYGSISGTVTDATGAVLPGATITVTQTETGRAINGVSSAGGTYVLPSLPPAHYTMRVTNPGFQSFQQADITLQADQA